MTHSGGGRGNWKGDERPSETNNGWSETSNGWNNSGSNSNSAKGGKSSFNSGMKGGSKGDSSSSTSFPHSGKGRHGYPDEKGGRGGESERKRWKGDGSSNAAAWGGSHEDGNSGEHQGGGDADDGTDEKSLKYRAVPKSSSTGVSPMQPMTAPSPHSGGTSHNSQHNTSNVRTLSKASGKASPSAPVHAPSLNSSGAPLRPGGSSSNPLNPLNNPTVPPKMGKSGAVVPKQQNNSSNLNLNQNNNNNRVPPKQPGGKQPAQLASNAKRPPPQQQQQQQQQQQRTLVQPKMNQAQDPSKMGNNDPITEILLRAIRDATATLKKEEIEHYQHQSTSSLPPALQLIFQHVQQTLPIRPAAVQPPQFTPLTPQPQQQQQQQQSQLRSLPKAGVQPLNPRFQGLKPIQSVVKRDRSRSPKRAGK